jgi:hypothetical protein
MDEAGGRSGQVGRRTDNLADTVVCHVPLVPKELDVNGWGCQLHMDARNC